MPRGPKGERRPADVIGAAIKVARIATGEEAEVGPSSPARHRRAKTAAEARSKKLTDTQRAEIARAAADARWKKSDD